MTLFKHLRAFALVAMASLVALTPMPAQAFKISSAVGDAALNAMKAKPNGGTLVIYSGTEPADPDTAISGNTVLATFTISGTACGSNSTSGNYRVCTISSSGTVTAAASGTATWARTYESDGTTADFDWTVGTSGSDINFNSNVITSGGNVSLSSLTLKEPIH